MTFLEKLANAFNEQGLCFALVGGHAVALHGAVRGTVDVDFVFKWNKSTLITAEKILNQLGLVSRLPINANDVYSFRDEYINKRNLIAWNFYNPASMMEQVDIIITYDLAPAKVKNIQVGATQVPVLKVAELIKMKQASGREQDLLDVDALQKIHNEKKQ